MIILKSLRFFSPADDASGGGGTAVIEPAAAPAAAPVEKGGTPPLRAEPDYVEPGKKYAEAIKDLTKGKDPAAPKDKPPAKKDDAPPAEKKDDKPADDKAPKEKGKGKTKMSALEAAASKAPPTPAADNKAKGPDPAPDPLADLPEKVEGSEKTQNHWAKSREVITGQGQKINELTAQLAKVSADAEAARSTPPETVARVAELEKKIADYQTAMMQVNIKLDPAHKEKFEIGRTKLVDKIVAKTNSFEGDGEKLREALGMKEGRARETEIEAALQGLSEGSKSRIMLSIADVEKLDEEEASVIENAEQTWETRKAELSKQQEADRAKTEGNKRAIFDKVGEFISDLILPLREVPADAEGATEWNAQSKEIRDKAWSLAQPGVAPEELAKAAFYYGAGPVMAKIIDGLRTELGLAHEKLSGYEAGDPGFKGGGQDAPVAHKAPAEKYHEVKRRLDAGEKL